MCRMQIGLSLPNASKSRGIWAIIRPSIFDDILYCKESGVEHSIVVSNFIMDLLMKMVTLHSMDASACMVDIVIFVGILADDEECDCHA